MKRFLLIFFAVYLGGMLVLNILFGPPGMSKKFMSDPDNRADYELYLEVIKNEHYKMWEQNPELNPADAIPHLADHIAFAQNFEARPDYQAEMHRRELYNLSTDFFHVAMMVFLIVKLARRPLLKFLDSGVEQVRKRIKDAEESRKAAAHRRAEAEEAISRLDDEKDRIQAEGHAVMEQDLAQIHEITEMSIAHVRQSAEDRKREEEQSAAMRVRAELVDTAVTRIVERFQSEASEADHGVLVEQFTDSLENLR